VVWTVFGVLTSFGVSCFLFNSIFDFSCVLTTPPPFGVSNFLFNNWTIGFLSFSSSSLLEDDVPFDFSIFKLFEIEVFGFSVVVLTVSFVVNLGVWIFVIVLTTSFGVSIFLLSIFGFSCVLTTPFGVSKIFYLIELLVFSFYLLLHHYHHY